MVYGRQLLVAPILFCALMFCTVDASAQGVFPAQVRGGHAFAGGYGYGFGGGGYLGTNFRSPSSVYSLGMVGVPPYFSLHPPVYYSAPVPRPYGYSPFPLPAGVAPAEPFVSAPLEIKNPHFVPGKEEEKQDDKKKKAKQTSDDSVAKVIYNPYFQPASEMVAHDAE